MDWTAATDAGGHFEVGTVSNATLACLSYSLNYIKQLGVENIQAPRQPVLRRLQKELPRPGFQPMTPAEGTSPIVTFAKKNTQEIRHELTRANVDSSGHV